MAKPYDARLIMMVAQQPFETADMNQFCKLLPIVYEDGTRPTPADFPNDGEIWWMLTAQSARLGEPGQLIVGILEDAVRYEESDPNSSRYQVKRDSVHDIGLRDGIEVIDLPGDTMDSIQAVVSSDFQLDLAAPLTAPLMLRWRSQLYGPFNALRRAHAGANTRPTFAFAPTNTAEMTVYRVDESVFSDATRDHRIPIADDVSYSSHRRSENFQLRRVRHEFVLASGYERVLATNPEKLVLEPLERKLQRYAKQCLTRKKRQELQGLLNELETTGREVEGASDLVEATRQMRQGMEKQDEALLNVAKAMLESGLLGDDRITKAEQSFAEKYVQQRTAELQAKAEESLLTVRDELRQLESQLNDSKARFQNEDAQRRRKLDDELTAEREKARRALSHEREEFEKQKTELQRQENMLRQNLEKVTKDLREAGDEVVNRFLTIAPLLGSLGLSNNPQPIQDDRQPVDSDSRSHQVGAVEFPAFVTKTPAATVDKLEEDVFFDRFRRVVENSGFSYRPLDLQRFHLTVKCADLTVLGGPPGTGKSSLPMLYARALQGEEAGDGRPDCLIINVNPSWMDTRDLLGHMNTLEGKFYPAETGLFHYLIYAQEEHRLRGSLTSLYLICLDEMNLSQVEHYFGDFMMALERSGPGRAIQCFSPEAVAANYPVKPWARLSLSPSLRFVGTVNFDETTRLLSDRFLDRVNLIRLKSAVLPGVTGAVGAFPKIDGRMVTLTDFEGWRADSALPPDLGSLLDRIRPLLNQMGCPISPRVYRAICRFVGSSQRVLTPAKAFDMQVTQRIIPRIRSLVTRRQLDALDGLLQLMGLSNECSFEESIPLLEEIKEAAGIRGWELEE